MHDVIRIPEQKAPCRVEIRSGHEENNTMLDNVFVRNNNGTPATRWGKSGEPGVDVAGGISRSTRLRPYHFRF